MTIRGVVREYRNKVGSPDVVMYIYMVDEGAKLGGCSIFANCFKHALRIVLTM